MSKLEQLNPQARRMAEALVKVLPEFRRRLEVLEHGDFRTHIRAPKGSQAYGLRVSTARRGEDTWIQFGVPNAFYDAETTKDLIRILRGLMSDRLRFALKEKSGKWTFTTLVRKSGDLVLRRGETGRIFSWSGARDEILSPNPRLQPTLRAAEAPRWPIRTSHIYEHHTPETCTSTSRTHVRAWLF